MRELLKWELSAAWLIVGGEAYINPNTELEEQADGITLTDPRTKLSLWVDTDSILGRRAEEMLNGRQGR